MNTAANISKVQIQSVRAGIMEASNIKDFWKFILNMYQNLLVKSEIWGFPATPSPWFHTSAAPECMLELIKTEYTVHIAYKYNQHNNNNTDILCPLEYEHTCHM